MLKKYFPILLAVFIAYVLSQYAWDNFVYPAAVQANLLKP